jgi:hypothetical protein
MIHDEIFVMFVSLEKLLTMLIINTDTLFLQNYYY